MHGKFVQITSVVSAKGLIALYALDEHGDIYEKLVGIQGSQWVKV